MGGVLGWLAGFVGLASKVDDNTMAHKIADGIDHLTLSEEERAKYILDYMRLNTDQNSVRSVARRMIACLIIGLFALLMAGSAIAWPFNVEYATHLYNLATSPVMGVSVGATIAFYFYIQARRIK
jgi:hypothetical protein